MIANVLQNHSIDNSNNILFHVCVARRDFQFSKKLQHENVASKTHFNLASQNYRAKSLTYDKFVID